MLWTIAVISAIGFILTAGSTADFRRPQFDKQVNAAKHKNGSDSSVANLSHVKAILAKLILASMLHKMGSNKTLHNNSTARRLNSEFRPYRKLVNFNSPNRISPFWSLKPEIAPVAANYQIERFPSLNLGEQIPVLTAPFHQEDLNGLQLLLLDELEPNNIPPDVLSAEQMNIREEEKNPPVQSIIKTSADTSDNPRCDKFTEDICLDDSEYPRSAIMNTIYRERSKFDLMYAESKERETQLEGLTRKQEESYTFEHYYGPVSYGITRSEPMDYGVRGGFVCPSEITYSKPHRAKNTEGKWKVIINVAEFTQMLRLEKCLRPGGSCNYVSEQFQSTCSQIYSYHRLMVFDKQKGLHVDVFKMPTGCSCFIKGSKYVLPQPQPVLSQESRPANVPKKATGKLTDALASIFHSKKQKPHSPNPQVLNYIQKQLAWFRYLNQNPQMMDSISPSNVLQQLLQEDHQVPSRQPSKTNHPNRWVAAHQPIPAQNMIQHLNKINREKTYTSDLIPADDKPFSEPLNVKSGFRPLRKPIASASQTQTSATDRGEPIESQEIADKSKEARINFSYHPILEYLS
ncbi:uncharacterized protein [Centruroides vittatus]|uniref:uncharacterized protein n=1 Tax=Centruroides vittatus TaxID=120091 RepID=UPI00350EC20F